MGGFHRRGVLIFLGAGAAVAGLSIVEKLARFCPICDPWKGLALPVAGLVVYGAMFLIALRGGEGPVLSYGIPIVTAVHVVLVASLAAKGVFCPLCVAAGINAAVLFALAFLHPERLVLRSPSGQPGARCDGEGGRGRGLRLSGIFSATLAGAVSVFLVSAAAARIEHDRLMGIAGPAASDGPLNVVVLESPDCHLCAALREKLIPRLEQEFGPHIRVTRRDAGGVAGVSRLPTIVISRSGIIEGLPEYETLRQAIKKALH